VEKFRRAHFRCDNMAIDHPNRHGIIVRGVLYVLGAGNESNYSTRDSYVDFFAAQLLADQRRLSRP
jgi:hypothetical protein